jgi:hypothetical protein
MGSTSKFSANVMLVLPKEGVHEVHCYKVLTWHETCTKFHGNWFRRSNNVNLGGLHPVARIMLTIF